MRNGSGEFSLRSAFIDQPFTKIELVSVALTNQDATISNFQVTACRGTVMGMYKSMIRCSSFRYLPDKKPTVGYSIPDENLPLDFSSVNWCKIDVFTSNIMVSHHKMSQTVKIKVNRYTNIYLLMNLFKINQFIFIFPVFQLYFHSYKQKKN